MGTLPFFATFQTSTAHLGVEGRVSPPHAHARITGGTCLQMCMLVTPRDTECLETLKKAFENKALSLTVAYEWFGCFKAVLLQP